MPKSNDDLLKDPNLLKRPDPNYKSDPNARGDAPALADEEEEEEDVTPADDKAAPAKKTAEEEDSEEDADADDAEDEEDLDEEEPEEEEEEPSPKADGKKQVPYHRLAAAVRAKNEALAKLQALQEETDRLKKTQSTAEQEKVEQFRKRIDNLYEEAEKARATGDYKEAARLQKELDTLRGQASRAEAIALSRNAAIEQQQVTVFNAALEQIEVAFPELTEGHPDFDPERLVELDETIRGYEALGMSLSDALRKASRRLLRYDPFAKGDKVWLDGPPAKAGEKAEKDEKPAKPAKKKTDFKKNAEAAARQPPDVDDGPADVQSKIDTKKLRPEEFAKLPDAVRRRLRGDTLVRS